MIDGSLGLRQVYCSALPLLMAPWSRARGPGSLSVFAVMLALGGCGDPSSSERLQRYVVELQRAVSDNAAAPQRPPLDLSVYPSRRSVERPIDDLMISVFEFLGISRHCGLGPLVGERNSSLGLVMPGSQRFVYEQALLTGLRDCRDRLANTATGKQDGEMLANVESIIERKSRELPRVFWNATFASKEFEALFSLSRGGALQTKELGRLGEATLDALAYLQAVYLERDNRDRPVDSGGLEAHLNNIRKESYGGRMLQTLRAIEHAARQASDHLETALDPSSRCESRPSLAGLHKVWVADWFAAYAATVEKRGRILLAALAGLADLPTESGSSQPVGHNAESFMTYRRRYLDLDGAQAFWPQFAGSLRRHQRLWERMLAPC